MSSRSQGQLVHKAEREVLTKVDPAGVVHGQLEMSALGARGKWGPSRPCSYHLGSREERKWKKRRKTSVHLNSYKNFKVLSTTGAFLNRYHFVTPFCFPHCKAAGSPHGWRLYCCCMKFKTSPCCSYRCCQSCGVLL
jgi:hypothetical protein